MSETTTRTRGARMRGVDLSIGGSRLLHGVDLAVEPGELVALIGPNGAGKSTALSVLAGDVRPDAGEVQLDDRDASSIRISELGRLRSVLLQQKGVAFSYPVRDVVAMGRMPWARTPQSAVDDQIVADALARTDVEHLADRDVTTLSGASSRASRSRASSRSSAVSCCSTSRRMRSTSATRSRC
ncbi:ATP-binding cassette domain-containing protein [Leifsonia poae]|uniref:ATP-binding cassette domain-containing protein n=1 Tax=Leifsonia poae TaxID=110933 RepID=UPI003D6702FF